MEKQNEKKAVANDIPVKHIVLIFLVVSLATLLLWMLVSNKVLNDKVRAEDGDIDWSNVDAVVQVVDQHEQDGLQFMHDLAAGYYTLDMNNLAESLQNALDVMSEPYDEWVKCVDEVKALQNDLSLHSGKLTDAQYQRLKDEMNDAMNLLNGPIDGAGMSVHQIKNKLTYLYQNLDELQNAANSMDGNDPLKEVFEVD